MKRNLIFLSAILTLCILVPSNVGAWKGDTHELISETAIYNSQLNCSDLLVQLNLEKGIQDERLKLSFFSTKNVMELIKHGSVKEDAMTRSFNHFHDPTEAWPTAQLDDDIFDLVPFVDENFSLILWAQNGNEQSDYSQGDNSWRAVRDFYYGALVAESEGARKEAFAKMFKGLGHQIHFIQDSSVPDHVRNHSHPGKSIESWAADDKNRDILNTFFQSSNQQPLVNLNIPIDQGNLVPITQLVDNNSYLDENHIPSDSYTQGLAEYTNSNFFCNARIFSSEEDGYEDNEDYQYPYPRESSTDVDLVMKGKKELMKVPCSLGEGRHYISKIRDGEKVDYFLAITSLARDLWKKKDELPDDDLKELRKVFVLDDRCYEDYARKLIPRAVIYSTALLDYFFRGDIEISVPVDGIFAFADDREKGFEKVTIHARNNMDGNEEMKDGELTLVVRYRVCDGDPHEGAIPPKPGEDQYFIVKKYDGSGHSIPRDKQLKLEFDLSDSPIPIEAADVNISLVFRGTIGEERNVAVGLGFLDISEPTPIDFVNSTYWIGMNYASYDVSDPGSSSFQAVFNMADLNGNGKIDCNLGEPNIYPVDLLPKYVSFNGTAASKNNYYHRFESGMKIAPYKHFRVYVLAEKNKQMKYSLALDTQSTNSTTQCEVIYDSRVQHADSRINCLVYNPATKGYDHDYKKMTQFHGAYRYLWRDYGLTHYPWPTYKFRNGVDSTIAGGSDLWQLPVLKLSGSISGPILTLIVTKSDGSQWITSGNIYAKVGSPETYGVDRYHGRVEVGEKSVSFKLNLADPNYIGGYPKDFYIRYEADGGGYFWVGPLWIEESQ